MVSRHLFSQLVLLALLWLFVILHLSRPKRPVTTPAVPAPSPSHLSALAPTRPNLSRASPTSPIAPCVNKAPRLPKRLLRCRPIPWHRPTGVPVRSTRPGTFVRTAIVTIGAGAGWGICAPMVIPVVAPGASSTAPRATGTFWRRMAPFCTANRPRLTSSCASWPAWLRAWGSAPPLGSSKSTPTRY